MHRRVRRGFTQSRRQCGTESCRMLTKLARDGRRHALLFARFSLACPPGGYMYDARALLGRLGCWAA